jgi:hypothetical protein
LHTLDLTTFDFLDQSNPRLRGIVELQHHLSIIIFHVEVGDVLDVVTLASMSGEKSKKVV